MPGQPHQQRHKVQAKRDWVYQTRALITRIPGVWPNHSTCSLATVMSLWTKIRSLENPARSSYLGLAASLEPRLCPRWRPQRQLVILHPGRQGVCRHRRSEWIRRGRRRIRARRRARAKTKGNGRRTGLRADLHYDTLSIQKLGVLGLGLGLGLGWSTGISSKEPQSVRH